VETWTKLDREYRAAYAAGHHDGVRSAKTSLGAMAGSLERDAQVESLLRGRRAELGVTFEMGRGLAHDLATSVGVTIGRNLGISL
jgi:hypothetical protein